MAMQQDSEGQPEGGMGDEVEHSGFVAVVRRPSSGKSSFLNTLCGYKVSIVSPVPQTTRDCIRAIHNDERMQVVFVDTPGIHFSPRDYNRKLSDLARQAIEEADAVLCLSDVSRPFGEEDRIVLGALAPYAAKTIVTCNKIDLVEHKVVEERIGEFAAIIKPVAIEAISALNRKDVLRVVERVAGMLPRGPRYYPVEYYTDQAQDFRIAEIIREKIFLGFREEIPHASCVIVEEVKYREDKERVRIDATICVEAESQKGMIIGAKGKMIKDIGIAARHDLEKIFGYGVDLFLRVQVQPNWRKDAAFLKRLGRQYER